MNAIRPTSKCLLLTALGALLLTSGSFAQVPLADVGPAPAGAAEAEFEWPAEIRARIDASADFDAKWEQAAASTPREKRAVAVDCDAGQTLGRALRLPGAELEIFFTGTCTEEVEIERDFVTLRGFGNAAISGSLTVRGSQRVVLRDFGVSGSSAAGISLLFGTLADLQDLRVEAAGFQGILIENSIAHLENATVTGSVADGISVTRGSVLHATGELILEDNGSVGLLVNSGTTLFADTFEISAQRNGFAGLGSQFYSNAVLVRGTLNLNDNGITGLLLAGSGLVAEGITTFRASGNGLAGALLSEGSVWLTFPAGGTSKEIVANQGYGVRADGYSQVLFGQVSEVTVSDNAFAGIGLFNSSGDVIGVTAAGNADADLIVDFGGRASLLTEGGVDNVICGVGGLLELIDAEGNSEIVACEPAGAAARNKLQAARRLSSRH